MNKELKIEKLVGHATTGKVGKILKNTGDTLNPGDVIFVIESGKGTGEYVSKYKGVLKELYISQGDSIKLNQVIGVVEGEEASIPQKPKYNFGISNLKPKNFDVDVAIIGGGPGGYVAAIRLAQGGKKVAIIEEDKVGGTCLNYGCIPTKSIISSVDVLEKCKEAEKFGIEVGNVNFSMEKIIERKDKVVNNLITGINHLLKIHKIELINGKAEIKDENSVIVKSNNKDIIINYKNLIIATGSKPIKLPIEGADHKNVLYSKDLLTLKDIPNSVTIIGGGVIGMEFAFIYSSLGVEVNVIEFLPQILNSLDKDVVRVLKKSASEKKIKIYENSKAVSIRETLDNKMIVEIEKKDKKYFVTSEKVIMSVGRKANIESIDIDKLGVKLNEKKNGILIDEYMRTTNPNVYAIGDVTNKIQLAHVASHQGIIAADHINGQENKMRYDVVPSAIFTMPEIAQVGITEKEAKNQNIDILIGKFPLIANGKVQAMGEEKGFVKIIANKNTRKVIGGTIIGVHATDMISIISNIIISELTIDQATHVIYPHPTTSESIHEALLNLDGKSIHFA